MTPQEKKAIELYNKMYRTDGEAKQAAIICVEEMLALKLIEDKDLQETTKAYWQDVLTELNKL
jgi:hypothetical protein